MIAARWPFAWGLLLSGITSVGLGDEEPPTMSVVPFRLAQTSVEPPADWAADGFARHDDTSHEDTSATTTTGRADSMDGGGKLLPPPRADKAAGAAATPATDSSGAMITVVSSLAIVIGCFLLFVWLMRRFMPRGTVSLPREAVEVLGRVPLDARQQLQLVRVGNKLVLLAVSAGGVNSVCEITEPHEVDYLLSACHDSRLDAGTDSFREVFHRLGSETPRATRAAAPNVTRSRAARGARV